MLNSFFAFLASLCNYSCPFLYRASFRKLAIIVSGSLISVFVSHSEARSRVAGQREREIQAVAIFFSNRGYSCTTTTNWRTLMTTRLRGLRKALGRKKREEKGEVLIKRKLRKAIYSKLNPSKCSVRGKEGTMISQLLLWRSHGEINTQRTLMNRHDFRDESCEPRDVRLSTASISFDWSGSEHSPSRWKIGLFPCLNRWS